MSVEERLARLEERSEHVVTVGTLYRALLIQTIGIIGVVAAALRLVAG